VNLEKVLVKDCRVGGTAFPFMQEIPKHETCQIPASIPHSILPSADVSNSGKKGQGSAARKKKRP